jgi:hypothetical protein
MQKVQVLVDIAGAVAALGAVAAAWVGLSTWRQQLRGTAEYDLAKRILRAVLKMRNQISALRNVFIFPDEIEAAFADVGIQRDRDDPKYEARETELVYQRRWNFVLQARTDLDVELLEAEILWGTELDHARKLLTACITELWSAILRHVREKQDRGFKESTEAWEKREAVLYQLSGDPLEDPFAQRLNAAIVAFETALRPHIGLSGHLGKNRAAF